MRRNFLTFFMGFIITFTFFAVNVKKIKSYKTGDSKDVVRYIIRSIVFNSKIGNITDGHVLTISARG